MLQKVKTYVYRLFTKTDELSWVGHTWTMMLSVWVFKLMGHAWYGFILAGSFYLIREVGDLLRWKKALARRPWNEKILDGLLDFGCPILGGLAIVFFPQATVMILGWGCMVLIFYARDDIRIAWNEITRS